VERLKNGFLGMVNLVDEGVAADGVVVVVEVGTLTIGIIPAFIYYCLRQPSSRS
jgi:hypothetical protein